MSQLKIFVSSTCYDLSQIRSDLFDFLSSTGYHPILSEYGTFPIDPDNDTIENCIQNVDTADIFILIVGNRYGYITDTGKSITNTEFLYAKRRGIPIYIFIYKPLINILPFWKKNIDADFSDTVDSVKVIEFVNELRNSNKSWCFEFEKAQEIIAILKIQFSHLFQSALDLRKKIKVSSQPEYWKNLSANAINLALNKEGYYEILFFVQVLKDELIKFESLKFDLDYHILLGSKENIQHPEDLLKWIGEKLASLEHFAQSGMNLMNTAYPFYYAEPGHPSDLKGLYYVASSLARLFKEMILWSIDIKSTYMDKDFLFLRDTFAKCVVKSAMEIWEYPDRTRESITDALEKYIESEITTVHATLTFDMDDGLSDIVNSEMKRLVDKYASQF
jgi:hypothetical protein